MSPYEILKIDASADKDVIVSAHAKLNALAANVLAGQPDLYKRQKYALDSAMRQLLDPSIRAQIDKNLTNPSDPKFASSRSSTRMLGLIAYPFIKIFKLLWFIFGPAAKYLAKIGVVGLRVGLIVFIIWSIGFAQYTEPYRKVALDYVGVVYDDFGIVVPAINFRDYLPGFLGGRYTYNSLACEKIRKRIAYLDGILEEEKTKSTARKVIGFGAALSKLVQGDTAKAKEYGSRASISGDKTDREIRLYKTKLERDRTVNLECTKKPA